MAMAEEENVRLCRLLRLVAELLGKIFEVEIFGVWVQGCEGFEVLPAACPLVGLS
jgi:hypothetical protein